MIWRHGEDNPLDFINDPPAAIVAKILRFAVVISFPKESITSKTFEMNKGQKRIIIFWTLEAPNTGSVTSQESYHKSEAWKSRDHFSILKCGWIPDHGVDFFKHFIQDLEQQ
jgi:hypothetical protein